MAPPAPSPPRPDTSELAPDAGTGVGGSGFNRHDDPGSGVCSVQQQQQQQGRKLGAGGVEEQAGFWLSRDPCKRYVEKSFMVCSVLWIAVVIVVLVTQAWRTWQATEYMSLGMVCSVPYLVTVIAAPRPKHGGFSHAFKVNVWMAIYSFIGNFYYTHYFYNLLNARYTIPCYGLNEVPFNLYFMTHGYFCFYHVAMALVYRRFFTAPSVRRMSEPTRMLLYTLLVAVTSYFTAFMETFTIASFPHYSFDSRDRMYTVGSAFYGLYFVVSFPFFYRLEEPDATEPRSEWTVLRVAGDSFAAGMIIMVLLDAWRLYVGHMHHVNSFAPLICIMLIGSLTGILLSGYPVYSRSLSGSGKSSKLE